MFPELNVDAAFVPGFSDPMADLNVEAMSSDKESGDSGSQNDLSKILPLPTPADFMSPVPSAMPKLMTPDAFMTPSTSVSSWHSISF